MVNETQFSKVKIEKTSKPGITATSKAKSRKKSEKRKFRISKSFITNALGILLIVACVILCILGYHKGLFTSIDTLQEWVKGFGIVAPLIFIIFQAVQVAVPIIPGGVTLACGVVIFGSWGGFWYNYIGIVLGSMAVFAISHTYGKPLMHKLFSKESIEKYESWTENHGRFAKLFAAAIFLPGAPDGLICYLAGTTKMSWKTYSLIILLCKPLSIALYSLGLMTVEGFTSWL